MTLTAMKEKIETLVNDEEFAAKLKVCKTAQEISDLYAVEGIEVTAEEIDAAFDAMIEKRNGELSVDELDNAAGGFFVSGGAFLAWSIAYSCVSIASAYSLGRMGY